MITHIMLRNALGVVQRIPLWNPKLGLLLSPNNPIRVQGLESKSLGTYLLGGSVMWDDKGYCVIYGGHNYTY